MARPTRRFTSVSSGTPRLAKLSAPRLPAVTLRRRLFARMRDNLAHGAVWLAGPPGSGKTTLATSFARDEGRPLSWFQVDAGDRDPASWFAHLALLADSAAGEPLPQFSPEHRTALPTFARRFFRALFALMPHDTLLVLDAVQEAASPLLHAALAIALEEAPAHLGLVLVSQSEPPAELASLVVNRRVSVLSADDLLFDLAETTELLDQASVPAASASAVLATTQGWVAGIVLAAEQLRRNPDGQPLAAVQTRERLFEYFAGSVFDAASPQARELLLRVAFLPTVHEGDAAALGAADDSRALFDALCERHLFIVRHDVQPPQYRLHGLFRDFLVREGERVRDHAATRALRLASARVLAARGEVAEAIPLLVDAEAFHEAAQMLERSAESMLHQGLAATFEELSELLPDTSLRAHPWLSYRLGCSRMRSDESLARASFEHAYDAFADRGDATGMAVAAAAALTAIHASYDTRFGVQRWIDRTRSHMRDVEGFPSAVVELKSYAGYAIALWTSADAADAEIARVVDRIVALQTGAIDPNERLLAAAVCVEFAARTASHVDLIDRMRAAAGDATEQASPFVRAKWLGELSDQLAISGRTAEARAVHARLVTLADDEKLARIDFEVTDRRVTIALCERDLGECRRALDAMVAIGLPSRPVGEALYWWGRACLELLLHRAEPALQAAQKMLAAARAAELPAAEEANAHNCLANALALVGRRDEARAAIAEAIRLRNDFYSVKLRCNATALEAYFALVDEDAGADDKVRAAFAEAAATGHAAVLRTFPELPRLCARALELDAETAFVREVIALQKLPAPHMDSPRWPWPVRIQALGHWRIARGDETVRFESKAQRKPLDLLKALVAFGGRQVDVGALSDALWPDTDGDAARTSFDTTLHRLRKRIGVEGALTLVDGKLSLDERLVWLDVWALGRCAEAVSALASAPAAAEAELTALSGRLFACYAGPLLADDPPTAWMLGAREPLRAKFLRALRELGKYREMAGSWDQAAALYERGLEHDGMAEELYRRLMRCHLECGRKAEAARVYERCRDALQSELGMGPSRETRALLERFDLRM